MCLGYLVTGTVLELEGFVIQPTVLQDALPLTEVESAFDTSIESIGDRDCRIQRVSALKGYALYG